MRVRAAIALSGLAAALLLGATWLVLRPPSLPNRAAAAAPPATGGRSESCLLCHTGVVGLGESHAPQRIGCSSCHRGDPAANEADTAHAGMLRVPGNVADARQSCGQAGCHLSIAPRVEHSIMTTMAGVIAADRRVLGEPVDPAAPPPHAGALGHSVADSHLRELCVSCHLGQPKSEWGPIGQESRGGGCNACHLVYTDEAKAELARYTSAPPGGRSIPRVHPSFTPNPTNEHCFGCHSRSSRIAPNYEGWNELRAEPKHDDPARIRKLDDGRYFERVLPDVHHERGLDCIDCHTSSEVMGSGALVARKSEQQRIVCSDCHARRLAAIETGALDPESRTLLALRGWTLAPTQRIGATRDGEALVNVVVDAGGRGELRRKRSGPRDERLPLKPPLPVCTDDAGHARLTCASCHSGWAPRCTTCHTSFDPADEGFDHLEQTWVKGTWNESSGPFQAALPTLGMRVHRGADGLERSVVETVVPGMILTFDRNREPNGKPDVIFRRLYGLTFAHTIRREARICGSCHADPVALGYGRGTLRYDATPASGRWRFRPREKPSKHDGLPADAWVGFLQTRAGMVSARDDVRPLNVDEQRRVLRVGACLTCHAGNSAVMADAVKDFAAVLARRSRRCVLPIWR